ncbi:hypothetical protein Tco_1459045 [Tanacetum coccineum]
MSSSSRYLFLGFPSVPCLRPVVEVSSEGLAYSSTALAPTPIVNADAPIHCFHERSSSAGWEIFSLRTKVKSGLSLLRDCLELGSLCFLPAESVGLKFPCFVILDFGSALSVGVLRMAHLYKSALRVSFVLLGNRIGAFTNLSFAEINALMFNDKIKPSVGFSARDGKLSDSTMEGLLVWESFKEVTKKQQPKSDCLAMVVAD